MIGENRKEFREAKGLIHWQIFAKLDFDTAKLSKMGRSDRPVIKKYLSKVTKLYRANEQELLALWLADEVYNVVPYQDVALEAMED